MGLDYKHKHLPPLPSVLESSGRNVQGGGKEYEYAL